MVNNAEYYSDAARDAPLNPLPSNSCIPPLEPGEDTHQLDLMRASRAYFCMDPYLERLRDRGVTKTAEFNAFQGSSVDRWKLLDGWINLENGAKCYLFPKFTCEYGFNITIKGECYIAPGCTFIDVSPITIGKDTMIGANSQLYTPHHPISPEIRNGFKGPEGSSPIVIGDNVWIGGGVIICPGVTIGDGTTIGAGSVVTKDIPARCVAVGNPARVVKRIEEDGTIVPVAKSA